MGNLMRLIQVCFGTSPCSMPKNGCDRLGLSRCVIIVCCAILHTACQPGDPAQSGPARQDRAAITLSAGGERLGPIDATTPFGATELALLLPDTTVSETTDYSEGESYPMLRIATADETLLLVRSADGKTIHSVEIVSGTALDGAGVQHGDRLETLFPDAKETGCVAGLEEQSGRVLCPAPASAQLILVFAGTWNGPDGELPPPSVLASWTVERILWRP